MRKSRTFRLAALGVLVAGLLAAMPSLAFADRTIGLSQGVFEISVAPGSTYTNQFLGENDGTENLGKVYIYTTDIRYDNKGNASYVPVNKDIAGDANQLRKSAAAWTRLTLPANTQTDFNAAWVALKPGEKIPVKFTITVPENATPGDYNAAIFLEMGSADSSATGGTASVVTGRIGVRLRIRVTGTVKQDFRFKLSPMKGLVWGQNVPLDAHFDNQGNVDVKVAGTLDFRQGSKAVQSFDMGNFGDFYLPAGEQMDDRRTLVLKSWWPGPRDVTYRVSYYDETIGKQVDDQQVQTVFFVPWQFVAILAFVLAAVIAGVLYGSRRRARKDAGTPPPPYPEGNGD